MASRVPCPPPRPYVTKHLCRRPRLRPVGLVSPLLETVTLRPPRATLWSCYLSQNSICVPEETSLSSAQCQGPAKFPPTAGAGTEASGRIWSGSYCPGTVWTGDKERGQGGQRWRPTSRAGRAWAEPWNMVPSLPLAMLGCSWVLICSMCFKIFRGRSGGKAEGERE